MAVFLFCVVLVVRLYVKSKIYRFQIFCVCRIVVVVVPGMIYEAYVYRRIMT